MGPTSTLKSIFQGGTINQGTFNVKHINIGGEKIRKTWRKRQRRWTNLRYSDASECKFLAVDSNCM